MIEHVDCLELVCQLASWDGKAVLSDGVMILDDETRIDLRATLNNEANMILYGTLKGDAE